jgi:hypothetical protein
MPGMLYLPRVVRKFLAMGDSLEQVLTIRDSRLHPATM